MDPLSKDEFDRRCQLTEVALRLGDDELVAHHVDVARELGQRLRHRTAELEHLQDPDDGGDPDD